jgi:hypothetical protein
MPQELRRGVSWTWDTWSVTLLGTHPPDALPTMGHKVLAVSLHPLAVFTFAPTTLTGALAVSAVTMDWSPVGSAGNVADQDGLGPRR